MVASTKRIVKESLFALLISATVSALAGFFLQIEVEKILALPFLLALIPPINDMGGNIGSILGARLSSALHLGLIEPKLKRQKVLSENLIEATASGLFSFLFVSIVLIFLGSVRGFSDPFRFSATFILTGVILVPLIVLSSMMVTVISYVKGLDPDNIVGPLITSIGDVLGVLTLLLVSKIVWV
ncbi:MAG: magnesium transporter [Candidatus Hadarchaeales archaeon]